MINNPKDPFDQKFLSRTFAPELILALRQILKKGDSVVDVGAQKGYITLHAAKLVGMSGRVFSVEPDSRSRKLLEQNCTLNSVRNVVMIGSALGSKSELRRLKLSSQLGWTSFYPNDRNCHAIIGEQEARISKMDDEILPMLSEMKGDRLAFVKIDCEGSEPEILAGMSELLTYFSPLIWIEINTGSLRAANSSEQAVLSLLWREQYRTYLPKIGRNKFGVQALVMTPYNGDNYNDDHRVFDILASRSTSITRLKKCGVIVED